MVRRISNPPNPWSSTDIEWEGQAPFATLEVYEESARTALSKNDSPDLGFRFSVNPYRGCYHGCAYCYARPTHQYLGWGAGTDFERRIVVKTNIADRLRRELSRPSWRHERIVFSGNTDCYQPLEARYRLTRACLEVCVALRTPVTVITKSALIRRDADVLSHLAAEVGARVYISIPFADDALARVIEPAASPIARRFEALEALSQAGVPVGVSLAPIILGLNDASIAELLARAKLAGAQSAFMTLVRLPGPVLSVFRERMAQLPAPLARRVEHALREARGGQMSDARFGSRMIGQGPRWKAVEALFESQLRKLGMDHATHTAPVR